MKHLKLMLTLGGVAFFVAACAGSATKNETPLAKGTPAAEAPKAPTSNADLLASARTTFQDNCVGCHKVDGKGGPNEFQGNKIKVPDFTSDYVKALPDEKYIKYITNGAKGEMPAFGDRLSETEIKDLVKYIRAEFQGK